MGNGILRDYRRFANLGNKPMTMKDFEKAAKIIKKAERNEKDDREILKGYTDELEDD